MAAAKKAAPVAALAVFGKPKGGAEPPGGDADAETEDDSELDPAFVDYAESAFPELEGDTARLTALKKMVEACVKGY